MQIYKSMRIIRIASGAVIFSALVFSAFGASAQSQSSQVFITWETSNFYPAYFEGKALPTLNSPVTVSVEATRNGALLDLSQAEIMWEIDGSFMAGGRGVKQVIFTIRKGVGDTHFVRVSTRLNQEMFESSVRVPVTSPLVVIDAPYPDRSGSGGGITLRALPFFFNMSSLSELSFSWLVDGVQTATESDNELAISGNNSLTPRTFQVSLEANNRVNPQETARARGQFSITP